MLQTTNRYALMIFTKILLSKQRAPEGVRWYVDCRWITELLTPAMAPLDRDRLSDEACL
jgi:hypothetical protein